MCNMAPFVMNFTAYVWAPNQLSVRSCIKIYKGCNTIFISVLLQHFNAACIQALASDQHPFFFVWCHPLQSGGGSVCVCVGGQAGSHWVWDKLFLISPAWPAALNNNNNIAFSQHWQRLTVACAAEPSAAPQNTPSETESSWESNTKEQKQKQNPLDSTKTEPPSLQEQSGWSANNKAVANCAFRCSFCFICRSRWQPALTSAFHPLVIYLLESPAVNRGWGHATVAHLLKKAELLTALWASSVPRCRPSLLAKVFHYEPFCPWASGAAHYDNHSGRVGYAPCLLYIVLLWWDTVACAGQGERRCSRGGGVGVWGGVVFNNRLVLNGLTGDNIWFFFERASAEAAVRRSGRKPVWLSPPSSALPTHIPLGPLL